MSKSQESFRLTKDHVMLFYSPIRHTLKLVKINIFLSFFYSTARYNHHRKKIDISDKKNFIKKNIYNM